MADRRMFTQKIIDSDAFLDMPASTQALYFHLNMRADDDGFVNNVRKIQRMLGASNEDLELLISKRFLLCFENGLVVIKHWKMHNILRKDRYSPTQYQEQMESLDVKENGAYTEKQNSETVESLSDDNLEPDCEEHGNHVGTAFQMSRNQMGTAFQMSCNQVGTAFQMSCNQVGTGFSKSCPQGKESKVKDIKGEESIEKREADSGQRLVDLFNSLCPSLHPVKVISQKTKNEIEELLNRYTLDDFNLLFSKAEASDFLKGENERKWKASFDWLIREENMAKVLNGNFDIKKSAESLELEAWERREMQKLHDNTG